MSNKSVPSEKSVAASQTIPVKRVLLHDASQLPLDYGTTPGGTLFSTTPGGTRIVYERAFLMQCRKSPHSLSPPADLPVIPGVTVKPTSPPSREMLPVPEHGEEGVGVNNAQGANDNHQNGHTDEPLFEMDV